VIAKGDSLSMAKAIGEAATRCSDEPVWVYVDFEETTADDTS
jgi:hypothetical protein